MPVITRHFARRKDAQTIARRNMLDGTFDAAHATLPFGIFLERIDGEETLLEVGNMRQNEVGHHLEIGAHLGDGTQEHHALDAAEGMVADQHKTTFLGNVFQLLWSYIDGDVHVFQQMVGKLTPLIISGSIEQTVDFAQTKKSVGHPRHASAEDAFQPQGILQIRIGNYFSHG